MVQMQEERCGRVGQATKSKRSSFALIVIKLDFNDYSKQEASKLSREMLKYSFIVDNKTKFIFIYYY